MTTTANNPSAFNPSHTVQEVTQNLADRMVAKARAGELSTEDAYGTTRRTIREYTIAGGSPGADVSIISSNGSIIGGYVLYYESTGTAIVWLDMYEAEQVEKGLKKSPQN